MPVKKKKKEKSNASRSFVIALSIVSMIGFLSITTKSLFDFSFEHYMESLWLFTLGIALILETSFKELKKVKKSGLTSEMLGKITMVVIGTFAVIGMKIKVLLKNSLQIFLSRMGLTAVT